MATEVLRPQDCLIERIRVPPAAAIYHRRSAGYSGNGNPSSSSVYHFSYYNNGNGNASFSYGSANPNPNPRSCRRAASRRSASTDDLRAAKASSPAAAEKVTILRRGESMESKIRSEALRGDGNGGLAVCGTQRLGPGPEMLSRRLGIVSPASDVYAGSAFAFSPAPSSLPLPSFSKKKLAPATASAVVVDDSATRDLRRLLRIG